MSDPPPSPLAQIASMLSKLHMLNMPCPPALGSQNCDFIPSGERGNELGGNGLPRSSRQTLWPASARRYAVTDPPNPDPTTTASKCSAVAVNGAPSWSVA